MKSFGVKSEGAFTEPLGSANQSASFSQNVYQWASLIRVKNWKMKKGFLRQGLSAKFLKFSRAIVKTKEEFDRLIFCDWLSCPITHSHYAAPIPPQPPPFTPHLCLFLNENCLIQYFICRSRQKISNDDILSEFSISKKKIKEKFENWKFCSDDP